MSDGRVTSTRVEMLLTAVAKRKVAERVVREALEACDRMETHPRQRPEIFARALEREGLLG